MRKMVRGKRNMTVTQLYDFAKKKVEENRELYISYLKKAISFNTTNPPGNEDILAKYIQNIFIEHDIESVLQQVYPNRSNVIGVYAFGTGGKKLLLNAHMDVVASGDVPWKFPPFTPVEEAGVLYGRGSSDDKGGLIAMLIAMLIFKEANIEEISGTIEYCGVMGEEASGIGTQKWLDMGGKADAAIVGEPSNLEIVTAHRGAYRPQYSLYGKTAHSSEPDSGENAVYYAAHFIEAIEKYHDALRARIHPLTGAPTVAVTVIQGGKKVNVIPDHVTLQIDRRLSPGEDKEEAATEIENILQELQISGRIGAYKFDNCLNVKEATETKETELIVQIAKQVLSKHGLSCCVKGMKASTDMYLLNQANIPSIIFAPGDMAVAHSPDEGICIQQFLDAIPVYVDLFAYYFLEDAGDDKKQ